MDKQIPLAHFLDQAGAVDDPAWRIPVAPPAPAPTRFTAAAAARIRQLLVTLFLETR